MWFRRRSQSLERYITREESLDYYLELLLERLDRIADALDVISDKEK